MQHIFQNSKLTEENITMNKPPNFRQSPILPGVRLNTGQGFTEQMQREVEVALAPGCHTATQSCPLSTEKENLPCIQLDT